MTLEAYSLEPLRARVVVRAVFHAARTGMCTLTYTLVCLCVWLCDSESPKCEEHTHTQTHATRHTDTRTAQSERHTVTLTHTVIPHHTRVSHTSHESERRKKLTHTGVTIKL